MTVLGQLGLSITASVAATLIVSVVQHETLALRAAAPMPMMTSGGKFAARIEALRAADRDDGGALPDVPRVPLLAADAMLQAVPIHLVSDSDFSPARPSPDASKPSKRVAHVDNRHRTMTDASSVLPPRRSDTILLAVDSLAETPARGDGGGIWTSTKGLYHQAVDLGGNMLDRVNPLNLLP